MRESSFIKKPGYMYTVSLLLIMLLVAFIKAAPEYFQSTFIDYYGLTSAGQGIVTAMIGLGSIVSLFISRFLSSVLTKPRIVTVSAIVTLIMPALIALSLPLWGLLVCYFIFGVSQSIINATSSALIADVNPKDTVPRYMGIFHGIFGLGCLAAPLFYSMVGRAGVSWQGSFGVIAVLCLGLYLVSVFFSRKSLPYIPQKSTQKDSFSFKDVVAFLKDKTNVLIICSVFFHAAHQCVTSQWIKRYVEITYDATLASTLALSFFWIGVTISRLFLVSAVPLSPKKQIVYGNILAAASMGVCMLVGSAPAIVVGAFLAGLFGGPTIPQGVSMVSQRDKSTLLAANLALFMMFSAQMIFPLITGGVVKLLGIDASMVLGIICAVVSAVIMAGARMQKEKASVAG